MTIDVPEGFDELEVEEQVEYVQMLWNRIVAERTVPVPPWHRAILAERLASRNSDSDVDWKELQMHTSRHPDFWRQRALEDE